MKTKTKLLLPTLLLSISISTTALAETEVKITASDAAANDEFGISVSIDGNYAIVGAYSDDDMGSSSGSAYIYFFNGTTWTQQAKITASDAAINSLFGFSVSIDNNYAIIGAIGAHSSSGSAYIFVRSGTTWTEQAKITASDIDFDDLFGWVVSISGDYAIIGAPDNNDFGSNSGSAYIFNRSGTTWTEQTKLTASDAASGDKFGISVSIDGDYTIVGARENDNVGSAYIFNRTGSIWIEQAKLNANDAASGDEFGDFVSISDDYVIIGAHKNDDGGTDSGSAYIFKRTGSIWTEEAKITASDANLDDRFGWAVSIDNTKAIVGTRFNDDNGTDSGSAYIFVRSGTTWTEQAKITADDATTNDEFGRTVSISGSNAIVGARFNDDDGTNSGSAYIYTGNDIGLSVELDSFTARQIANTIQLDWTTASEKNNEGFNIYRRNGNGDFTQIASYKGHPELIGALNSASANNYTFIDDSEFRNGETYTYYISDVEFNGTETKHEEKAQSVLFKFKVETQALKKFKLAQNHPNPFNPSTTISYQIAKDSKVSLNIYNEKGEFVKELTNGFQHEGSHKAVWDGTDSFGNQVSSGTYFYKLQAGTFTQTNKMILLK